MRRTEAGRVAVDFAVRDEFLIAGGAVQGGIVTAYAEACMTLAADTLFDHGESRATSSITVSLLRPISEGPVSGEGDCRGRECARATSVGSIRTLP